MMIKCEKCGKEIEQKGNRVLCIKCTNERQRENAKIYRDTHQEHVKALAKARYERTKKLKSNSYWE